MKKRLQTLQRLTIAGIALLIFSFGLMLSQAQAQTVLISPTGDGGFENGATFGANGWTLSNSTNNPWVLGTTDGYTSTPFAEEWDESGKMPYDEVYRQMGQAGILAS